MRRSVKYTIPPEYDGAKVKTFLRSSAGLSARIVTDLKKLPDGILLNGGHIRTVDILKAGDALEINLPEDSGEIAPEDIPLDIVYEDSDILVINKPAGIAMHPTHNHQGDTLANGVAAYYARKGESRVFRAVGRLDKCTSGLVVCALNSLSASVLAGKIKKTYLALPSGRFEGSGKIDKKIYRPDPMKTLRAAGDHGDEALTLWQCVKAGERYSLVRVEPQTGRTHQIRVHFASLGAPLQGDEMYGGSRELIDRAALHCAEVSFFHPVTKEPMRFYCDMPEDMRKISDRIPN